MELYGKAIELYNSGAGKTAKAGEIIRRSVKLGKNPYSNEVFADTKDFKAALERCEM
jgi:hypothetical protein